MEQDTNEVLELMRSVQVEYFPELADCIFHVEKQLGINDVAMRVVFGKPINIYLYYSDARVLSDQYRAGLIPVIAHEFAHVLNLADPEQVMSERLPASLVTLWRKLKGTGDVVCSMDVSPANREFLTWSSTRLEENAQDAKATSS